MSAPGSVLLSHSTDHWTKSANKCDKCDIQMQHAKWFSLDNKSREVWDQLDNRAKPIILGYENNGSGSSSMSFKPGTKFGPFQRKLDPHEISAHDFIQTYSCELEDPEMYEQNEILILPDKSEVDDDPPNSSDTQRVNTATLSNPIKLSPADLQQVVSDTFRSPVNKYLYSQMFSIFVVNGGTDDGVACANVDLIFKISCTGDIKRIDSHQVKGVTIGSKWGVATNCKGPVVAIFYK
jgi:hypothetical protein